MTVESLGTYATASEIRKAEAVAAKGAVFGSVLGSLAYAGADLAEASLETKNKLANDVANLARMMSLTLPSLVLWASVCLMPSDPSASRGVVLLGRIRQSTSFYLPSDDGALAQRNPKLKKRLIG